MILFLLVIWIGSGKEKDTGRGHVEFKAFGKQGQTRPVSLVQQHTVHWDHEKWVENFPEGANDLDFLRKLTRCQLPAFQH